MTRGIDAPPPRRTWARGLGVSLLPSAEATVLARPALVRALADGIAHGHDGPLPAFPEGATWHLVREGGTDVGVAVLRRDYPGAGEAALLAIAIAPEHRGRAVATKALLVIERRLKRLGVTRLLTRVPRTNGRGLYFMLRAGYTPLPPAERPAAASADDEDVTWFARGGRN